MRHAVTRHREALLNKDRYICMGFSLYARKDKATLMAYKYVH